MERDRKLEIKVGLFVAMGIFLALGSLVGLGSEQNLFEKNYVLRTEFNEIAGLRPGAAVRLAGMDVGVVTDIRFNDPNLMEAGTKHLAIRLRVARRFQQQVRADTVATIQTQGVLGDQYIALSLGSEQERFLDPNEMVNSVDPESLFTDIPEIKEKLLSITDQLDKALRGEDGEMATKSITGILESLRNIVAEVEQGKGLVHALVYDESVTADFKGAIDGLDKTADAVAAITKEIQHGDGTLHALVYENHIKDLVQSLKTTADNLDEVVRAAKEGDGVVHSLLYGDEGKNLIDNLTVASADIRSMISDIEGGKGTIGALIQDPTIYEDIKALLGGAKRNQVLKSYVRDTIRKNEQSEGLSDGGAIP